MTKKKIAVTQNKNFLIILLSSILIIGLTSLYLITNNTTSNDNLIEYVDPSYKFSFNYPADESIDKSKNNPRRVILSGRGYDNPLYSPLAFSVYDNQQNKEIRDWFKSTYPLDKVTSKSFEDITINNLSGIRYLVKGSEIYSYFIKSNKIVVSIDAVDGQIGSGVKVQNEENAKVVYSFKFKD